MGQVLKKHISAWEPNYQKKLLEITTRGFFERRAWQDFRKAPSDNDHYKTLDHNNHNYHYITLQTYATLLAGHDRY